MATATDAKALEFVRRCEAAGKVVRRLVIEGKRIEVEFAGDPKPQDADLIDWRPKRR